MHKKLTCLNSSGGKSHDCNIIWFNSIYICIFPDKPDGSGNIESPLFLSIRRKPVIYNKCLETVFAESCCSWQGICIISTELISSSRHQYNSTFWRYTFRNRNCCHIRAEIPVVKITSHVFCKRCFCRDIFLFP